MRSKNIHFKTYYSKLDIQYDLQFLHLKQFYSKYGKVKEYRILFFDFPFDQISVLMVIDAEIVNSAVTISSTTKTLHDIISLFSDFVQKLEIIRNVRRSVMTCFLFMLILRMCFTIHHISIVFAFPTSVNAFR